MSELNDNNNNIENITNGVISYLLFLKKFKTRINDQVISNEQNANIHLNMSYTIREFKLDCYIIDKKNFDNFRSSINFNKLIQILNTINEENKEKFKKVLKQYLDKHPYTYNGKDIKIYSKIEEMKEIVKDFNNYSFINKELLFDVMGAPKSHIEECMLKVSRNEKNTSLYSSSGNFLLSINIEKKEKENEKKNKIDGKNKIEENAKNINKFKNLYYADKNTLKILILLYANEKIIEKKIKNPIKNKYNFRKYYLINKDWLKEYKEFFLYDFVIKKIEEDPELKDPKYSYKNIIYNLDNIVNKKIPQIPLGDTEITEKIRNANNLFHKVTSMQIKKEVLIRGKDDIKQETESSQIIFTFVDIPIEFELVDEEIFNFLMQEEFFINFNDNIKDQLQYLVLFGNNIVIIKNKNINKSERLKAYKEYLIYSEKSLKKNIDKEENEQKDSFILDYILNYGKEESFFKDTEIIFKKNGLQEFMTSKDLDINKLKFEQNIRDKNSIYGKFINLNINEEDIIKVDNGIIIEHIQNDNNKNESLNNNINKNPNNEIQNDKVNNNIINKNHNNKEEKKQIFNNKINASTQCNFDDFDKKENNNKTNDNILGSFTSIEKINNKIIVKENDINYFKEVEVKINENKNINNIKKYMNLKFKDIKNFYLINEEWLNLKINDWEQELTIKPIIETGNFFYSFPINFGFLEEEENEELIKKISKKDKSIENDKYISKIFFIYGSQDNPNSKVYIGVLKENYISFYLLSSENYYPEFLINYNNEDILSKEINDGMIQKGIEKYLNIMGIMDLSNKKTHPLYNFKLEKIGNLYLPKEKDVIKINNSAISHSKCLNYIKDSYYYNSVIQCLVNIGPLKNIFLNRSNLIENKIVKSHNLTEKFYELFQSMWNYSQENENNVNYQFMETILGFSYNVEIFKDIKTLIEFILLSIHSEQKANENNSIIIYELESIKKELNNAYSFLTQLFSFNVLFNCKKCKEDYCTRLYMLNFDIDKINSKSIGQTINFINLLKTEKFELFCNNCQNTIFSKISFGSFPIILIIIIKIKKNTKFKFDYIEKLELQNFFEQNIGGNFQYELIDIIKCKDKKGNKYETEIYCKSSDNDNFWNKYTQTENGQEYQKIYSLDKGKISEDVPYLLIYQKIDKNN